MLGHWNVNVLGVSLPSNGTFWKVRRRLWKSPFATSKTSFGRALQFFHEKNFRNSDNCTPVTLHRFTSRQILKREWNWIRTVDCWWASFETIPPIVKLHLHHRKQDSFPEFSKSKLDMICDFRSSCITINISIQHRILFIDNIRSTKSTSIIQCKSVSAVEIFYVRAR